MFIRYLQLRLYIFIQWCYVLLKDFVKMYLEICASSVSLYIVKEIESWSEIKSCLVMKIMKRLSVLSVHHSIIPWRFGHLKPVNRAFVILLQKTVEPRNNGCQGTENVLPFNVDFHYCQHRKKRPEGPTSHYYYRWIFITIGSVIAGCNYMWNVNKAGCFSLTILSFHDDLGT